MVPAPAMPYYLELQLKTTLEAVARAAKEQGLEQAMAFELWELRQRTSEVWQGQNSAEARRVIESGRAVLARMDARLVKTLR